MNVPAGNNQLLALRASIRIQEMRHQQEPGFSRHVTIVLVLSCTRTQGSQEQDVPRNSNLKEHLEIQPSEQSRVQFCAHEEVVDGRASHAMFGAAGKSGEVGDNGDQETRDYSHTHDASKLIDESVKRE